MASADTLFEELIPARLAYRKVMLREKQQQNETNGFSVCAFFFFFSCCSIAAAQCRLDPKQNSFFLPPLAPGAHRAQQIKMGEEGISIDPALVVRRVSALGKHFAVRV